VTHRAQLTAQIVDTVQGVGELLAFGRERDQLEAVRKTGLGLAREQRRAAGAASLGSALVVLLADLTCLTALCLALRAVHRGDLDGVQLAVVALVTLTSFEAVAGLPAAFQTLAATRVAGARLHAILEQRPSVVRPVSPARAASHFTLAVRHLRFRYPDSAVDTLEDVSFQLSPRRLLAIVGPSGAGKSTLASLLLRYWDVPPGMLFLGGRDVRELDPEAVRAHFGVVSQHVHLLNGNLRQNLLLGQPAASEAELLGALRGAGLESLIARLPDGLDTWIGEQGVRLSGGELQRVGLARALLTESRCLLLDEPTAHLDPDTERALVERLVAARAGRAVLLITHRLVGLERADEVLVLDRGRVVERGAAAELLRRGGLFARMRALQRAEDLLETL
jgi:ATP-binding cassette subfamily C protein CydC